MLIDTDDRLVAQTVRQSPPTAALGSRIRIAITSSRPEYDFLRKGSKAVGPVS